MYLKCGKSITKDGWGKVVHEYLLDSARPEHNIDGME